MEAGLRKRGGKWVGRKEESSNSNNKKTKAIGELNKIGSCILLDFCQNRALSAHPQTSRYLVRVVVVVKVRGGAKELGGGGRVVRVERAADGGGDGLSRLACRGGVEEDGGADEDKEGDRDNDEGDQEGNLVVVVSAVGDTGSLAVGVSASNVDVGGLEEGTAGEGSAELDKELLGKVTPMGGKRHDRDRGPDVKVKVLADKDDNGTGEVGGVGDSK